MNPLIKDLRAFYADQLSRGHSEREAWRAVSKGLPVCITTIHLARIITQPISPTDSHPGNGGHNQNEKENTP